MKHFRIINILMIAIILVIFARPAKADLIALVTQEGPGSRTSASLKGAISTEATLFFGFGFNSFHGGTQPYGIDMDYAIGLDLTLNSGDHGQYTFNSSNSADFNAIANKLTDGYSDPLTTGSLFHVEFDSTDFLGSAGTGPESSKLEINNDLSGYAIDSIVLDLDELRFSITEFDTVGTLDYFVEAEWMIYGHPVKPVPEPSTYLLIGSCLVGIAIIGRRTQKK